MYALLWSFAGDAKLKVRSDLGDFIRSVTTVPLPPSTHIPIIDYEVSMAFGQKQLRLARVLRIFICVNLDKEDKVLEDGGVSTVTLQHGAWDGAGGPHPKFCVCGGGAGSGPA